MINLIHTEKNKKIEEICFEYYNGVQKGTVMNSENFKRKKAVKVFKYDKLSFK